MPSQTSVPPLFIACVMSSGSPGRRASRAARPSRNGALELLRERDRVADVVVVAVREDDQVDALGLALGSGHFGFPSKGST